MLLVTVVLVFTSIALVLVQQRQLTSSLDRSLAQRADDLALLIEQADALPATLANTDEEDTFAQVAAPDGTVLAATANIAGVAAIDTEPGLTTVDGVAFDDDPFRVLTRTAGDPPALIRVGVSAGDAGDSIAALVTSLAIGVPVVVALMGWLIWWLIGRTLAPIEAIRAEADTITGGEMGRRVPEPAGDDEVSRLAATMNRMLGRIEQSMARQQRFVADASHELRSPVTRIRTQLEVDQAHPERADLEATHRSILEETTGLQRIIDDLLHLARSDAGAEPFRAEPVDLDDLVLAEATRLRDAGRVKVDAGGVGAARVVGDRHQLARAIRNVVENAERHAASTVTLTLAERDGVAELSVADDGPGIPAEHRERVFERFSRLDEARSATTGGTGLGLAITRAIVERHGGTATVDGAYTPGARLVLTLPLG